MISDILNKNGSDKCIRHTYQLIYDSVCSAYDRNQEIDILESGVEKGGSLSAWKEYFPNARVTGVDIVDQRLPKFVREDVEFVLSDIKKYKPDRYFDIIIEDGNHSNEDAIWAGVNLSQQLKVGGTLIIEDIQEGFIVPMILWGKLHGDFMVSALDMRRITQSHDNFAIKIDRLSVTRK